MTASAPRSEIVFRGRCWRFGHDLCVDGDLIPFRFVLDRETRVEVLREHSMTAIDPEFPRKAKAGDLVVAGRRFAQGNPHIQGLLGLRGVGVGLIVESIPRGSFRNAINAGLPILPSCSGVTSEVDTGDELEVDFRTGRLRNITRGTERWYKPLPDALLARIELGNWEAHFKRRLEALLSTNEVGA